MTAFQFEALDAKGRSQKGLLEGDSSRQVRQLLRERGWTPLQVAEALQSEQKDNKEGATGSFFGRRLAAADLALFTRQLSTLVEASIPIEEALHAVAKQSEKESVKSLIMAVRTQVLEGNSLSSALSHWPAAFPNIYRATVDAGEQSGYLGRVLERLADFTEGRQQMSNRIKVALFYPAMLSGMALLIVILLLTYVVPQVIGVFDDLEQELPWMTQKLITLSDFLKQDGYLLLLAIIAFVVLFRIWLRVEKNRFSYHRFLLRLPFFARLIRGFNSARFARTLSILVVSRVPILEALRIAAAVLQNLPMRRVVEQATDAVSEGLSVSRALTAQGHLFPPMLLHLIASGEGSGRLAEMLERAAIHQEQELGAILSITLGLLEPLVIIVMGAVVMAIVLAILLPIFELNQLVG